jgi:hypothetical protein
MTEHTEKQSSTKDTSSHGDTNLPDLTTDSPDLADSLFVVGILSDNILRLIN